MALAQSCKKYQLVCVDTQIPQLLKGGIDQWGVSCDSSFFLLEPRQRLQIFELCKIRELNLLAIDANAIVGEDNVNSSTKGIEHG
jgi:hypothetical protein